MNYQSQHQYQHCDPGATELGLKLLDQLDGWHSLFFSLSKQSRSERMKKKNCPPKKPNNNQWICRILPRRLERIILQKLRCWEYRSKSLNNGTKNRNKNKVKLCRLLMPVCKSYKGATLCGCASLVLDKAQTLAAESLTLFVWSYKYRMSATCLRSCRMLIPPISATYRVDKNSAH